MRFGHFSLLIPEGREVNGGHVEMPHGKVYTLRLGNHEHSRRCDAAVMVDGKEVGCFRLAGGQTMTLERPAHDTGCFTFFRADSAEGQQAGAANVGKDERGLVQVTFRPERQRRPQGMLRSVGLCSIGEREEKTSGSLRGLGGEPSFSAGQNSAGVTGLTGQSAQSFYEVAALDYDPSGEVTISLRLVAGMAVRELTPTVRGNAVPAPVE